MRKKIINNLEKLVKEIEELKKLVSNSGLNSDYISGGIYRDLENELETVYMSLEILLKELKEFY